MALVNTGLVNIFIIICLFNNVFADELIFGFYSFPDKKYIDKIAGSSFKYLIPYGTDGIDEEKLKDFLDYAYQKDIKIIFSLKDSYKTSKWYPKIKWCSTDTESDLAKCIINKFGNHPAIYGFYLADDATDTIGNKNLSILKQHSKLIRKITKKPVFVNDYPLPRGKLWQKFYSYSDYFIGGIYPIPEDKPEKIYDVVKDLNTRFNKPVIALVQAHGKYQYIFYKRDEITGRPPTFEEIRKIVASINPKFQDIIPYEGATQAMSGQAAGVFGTLAGYLPVFKDLARIDGDFSIKKWINNEIQGNIFVTSFESLKEAIKPSLSLFINLMILEILSLPDDRNRRIYLVLDEFGALQYLPAIVDGLTLGRSKGLSILVAGQDIAKFEEIYGPNLTRTIVNACTTKFVLGVSDEQTAQTFSNIFV